MLYPRRAHPFAHGLLYSVLAFRSISQQVTYSSRFSDLIILRFSICI